MEDGVKLYACCPRCGRQICKAKTCDGMELSCSDTSGNANGLD